MEAVRTRPAAEVAACLRGWAPCHTPLPAAPLDCPAAMHILTGPVTPPTRACQVSGTGVAFLDTIDKTYEAWIPICTTVTS